MTELLISSLQESGYKVDLVDRRFSESISDIGRFSLRKVVSAVSLWMRLVFALRRTRPQAVIFFSTTRAASFLVDSVLFEILRLFRVPTINYVHTVGYQALASRGRLWQLLVRRQIQTADKTVVLDKSLAKDLEPWLRLETLFAIPNALVQSNFGASSSRSPRTMNILFLSNLIPEKGAGTFVDVAIDLSQQDDRLSFQIAGAVQDKEYHSRLQESVREAQLESRIVFLGHVMGDAKTKLLSAADILVFPSTYPFEAQPLVVLEAMEAGAVVVAYDVGAMASMVRDGVTGLLCRPGDQANLQNAVASLVDNPEMHLQMSTAAIEWLHTRFSRESYTNSWLEVLESTAPAQRDAGS